MVAGPPETLTLPGWDPEEVSSDHSFKTCAILLKLVVLFLLKLYMFYAIFAMLENRPKVCQIDEMYKRKHCDKCDRLFIQFGIEY